MRGKDDLFHLVKAMSRSEKRYFTLDTQKSGKRGARYLSLFRYLSDMEVYEDDRLKKKFPKNLSADKAYLYEAIMRSMRDYRSPKSKAAQIKEKILDSKYLFERGLYEQCDSRLEEARDLAHELGDELLILEVIRERLHTIKSNKEEQLGTIIKELLKDEQIALSNVNEFFTYSDAYYEILVDVSQRFQSSTEEEKEELKKRLDAFFSENDKKELSAQATRRFYQSRGLYSNMLGDMKGVLENFQEVVNWWDNEENKTFKEEEFSRYMQDFSNLLYACQANKDFKRSATLLIDFRKNKPKHYHEERVWKVITYHYELLLFLNAKPLDFKKSKELLEEIGEGIETYKLHDNMVIIGNVGILHFMNGDFEKSQIWLTKIISKFNLPLRKDVQVLARLLSLINIYEIGTIEELDNFYRAINRFMKKNEFEVKGFHMELLQRLGVVFKSDYNKAKFEKEDFKQFLKAHEDQKLFSETLLYWLEAESIH